MHTKQLNNFSKKSRRILPRLLFMADLEIQITTYTNEGNQLIIMVDLKIYIYIHQVKTQFYKLILGELIIDKHGYEGPAMTRSNKKSHTIDRIVGSQGMTISK